MLTLRQRHGQPARGRGLRGAVADWYGSRPLRDLAYQGTKYAQRGGWSHRDALRLAHPKADGPERDACLELLLSAYPDFDSYQQLTERRLPIALLTRKAN